MSKQNVGGLSKLPEGWTEEEIDELANEAYENGTMTAVDILGNEEPFSKNEDIIHGMFTGKEKPVEINRILSVIKHLQGKVLTVIDATFIDEKRSKYVKDLIKDAFSNSSNWLYELSIRNFKEEQKNKK